MDRLFRFSVRSLFLLFTATLFAPPERVQRPVKLPDLGEMVDREFAKLTDLGITPFLAY
jgi:hypothetical protein